MQEGLRQTPAGAFHPSLKTEHGIHGAQLLRSVEGRLLPTGRKNSTTPQLLKYFER